MGTAMETKPLHGTLGVELQVLFSLEINNNKRNR